VVPARMRLEHSPCPCCVGILGPEVLMTSNEHMHQIPPRPAGRVSLDELARRKGVCPVESMDELVCDVFDSDAELDEFLTSTYAARRADLG
jgi:hypothetical protein